MTMAASYSEPPYVARRVRRGLVLAFTSIVASSSISVAAHDVRGSAVYLDLGHSAVGVELHLPVRQLRLALQLPETSEFGIPHLARMPVVQEYLRDHVSARTRDGVEMRWSIDRVTTRRSGDDDELIVSGRMTTAAPVAIRWFDLHCDVILHRVVTHNTYVFLRRDLWHGSLGDSPELLGMLHWQRKHLIVDRGGGSVCRGLAAAFALGSHHIAEGTDHLLFLLMLLLPAPLNRASRRWGKPRSVKHSAFAILGIVSAFTVGHSLTLVAGVLIGPIPSLPLVETLIAASIVLSAAHALRPIVAGREVFVALGFGLIHGLAFASALHDIGFDPTALVLTLLGFNLGIEAMQLGVVLVVMPWLTLASRHRSYTWLRAFGAGLGIVAGLGWIADRAFGAASVVPVWTERLASQGSWLAVALAVFSLSIHASKLGQVVSRWRVRP